MSRNNMFGNLQQLQRVMKIATIWLVTKSQILLEATDIHLWWKKTPAFWVKISVFPPTHTFEFTLSLSLSPLYEPQFKKCRPEIRTVVNTWATDGWNKTPAQLRAVSQAHQRPFLRPALTSCLPDGHGFFFWPCIHSSISMWFIHGSIQHICWVPTAWQGEFQACEIGI